jgi:hypothetical protein
VYGYVYRFAVYVYGPGDKLTRDFPPSRTLKPSADGTAAER